MLVEARRRIFDWHEEQVYLKDIEPRVLHKKLPLTLAAGVGVGTFALAAL